MTQWLGLYELHASRYGGGERAAPGGAKRREGWPEGVECPKDSLENLLILI